jgi:hypothetical protein
VKGLLVFLVLVLSQNVFALDINFQLKPEYKQPEVTKMSCSGQTCSCAADTFLDVNQMRCLKCEAGLQLDKNQKCVDPNAPTEETVRGWSVFNPEIVQGLVAEESSLPTLCDVQTAVDGKFKDCQCPDSNLSFELSQSAKIVVSIQKTFNRDSQKCERSRPYLVKVPNRSCYGPEREAFQALEAEGLLKDKYESPGWSLGSCGAEDGVHNLQLSKSENMRSVLDAIAVMTTVSPRSSRTIKSFSIDPKTINY